MSEYAFEYLLVGILGLLSIFSFLIGSEQMIKIIVSNYIINIICLACSTSISLVINFLSSNPAGSFIAISYEKREIFFSSGQTTMVLILYGILLLTIFRYSKIHITLPEDTIISNIIQIVLIPLTVFSVIFSLQIAIFGDQIVDSEHTRQIATTFASNPSIYKAIILTPIRMAIHGLVTLRLTTQVGLQYNQPHVPTPVFE